MVKLPSNTHAQICECLASLHPASEQDAREEDASEGWNMKNISALNPPPPPHSPPRHSYLLKSNENLTFSDLSPIHHCHSMAILVALKRNSPHLFPQFIRKRDKNTTTPA